MYSRNSLLDVDFETKLFFIYDATDLSNVNEYVIRLHSVAFDGRKITINLKTDQIFFDIKIININYFDHLNEFKPSSYEIINKQPFDSTEKSNFIRLYFEDHKQRKQAIDKISEKEQVFNDQLEEIRLIRQGKKKDENGKKIMISNSILDEQENEIKKQFTEFWQTYDTYSDDATCHYRKFARENDFELVGWYKLKEKELYNNMTIELNEIERYTTTEQPKLLILSWDIETSSTRGPGYFPVGENTEDYMYMIQFDIYSLYEIKKRFCLTTIEINKELFKNQYQEDIIFIKLDTQKELILKFSELYGNYNPDIEVGYNTGGFDWNFVLKKVKEFDIEKEFTNNMLSNNSWLLGSVRETNVSVSTRTLEDKLAKYEFAGLNINNRSIKVNPMENMNCEYYYTTGTVFIDLLVWAKKTFQTEISHTLDNVLKRCELEGKIDLPYVPDIESDILESQFVYANAIMFKDNKPLLERLAEQLSKLTKIKYEKCVEAMIVDDNTLEQYAVKIAYYCSIDSIRCKELMMKRNIINDYIELAKLSCVTISNVFTNGVGCLVRNFYGRIASRNDYLISMKRKGIIEIGKYIGGLVLNPLNTNRPVADLDFNSEYPNAIRTMNISKDTKLDINSKQTNVNVIIDEGKVFGKFISHEGDKNKMGLMPIMVEKLLNERSEAKQMMKKYKDAKMQLSYYTSKSNALKVIGNAVYGETGYPYSPLYDKEVSSSVTAYSRWCSRQMKSYLESEGCQVIYGDTDSMFFTIPEKEFTEIDKRYKQQQGESIEIKKLYWSEMIEKTIIFSKEIETKVNEHMKKITGYSFMRVSYEKTLMPSIFLQKKQYCGCVHENEVNLDNPKLLVKGMKMIKRDASKFYKQISEEIVWNVLGFENKQQISNVKNEPLQVVKEVITKYMNETNPEMFKLTAKYNSKYKRVSVRDFWNSREIKETSGNKMVINFVTRMKDKHNIIIEPGRFFYLIVKMRGKPQESVSENMWPYTEFDKEKQEIDIKYYFNSLGDIFASLLKCDKKQVSDIIDRQVYFTYNKKREQSTIDTYFNKRINL
jgi:DNA polymerase elongation subunit (family B)